MRDPDMMIAILSEMKDQPDGRLLIGPPVFAMSEHTRKRRHHVELLDDAGLACWESKAIVRITNEGYDFMNALQQGPSYRKIFMDAIGKGKTIVDAVNAVVTAVRDLT